MNKSFTENSGPLAGKWKGENAGLFAGATARSFSRLLVFLFVALLCSIAVPASAQITEPDTIFYGKVINPTSGQRFVLDQGTLLWTINCPDGRQLTLTALLQPLNRGEYSYQLLVPHEALAFGLTTVSGVVPLTVQKSMCSHLQIAVDGFPARILAPGSVEFSVAQSARASSYRLDLEVINPLADTDGDGIPDWWKSRFGAVDPNGDLDGDGWSNLHEFRLGANPNQDNRIPTLATTELFVYADGTSGVRLEALDSDSSPANLVYALTAAPQSGTLYLRQGVANPENSDAPLAPGASFTQEDVVRGRLVFRHNGTNTPVAPDGFSVSLRDENPDHPATNGVVALHVYRPSFPDATLQLAQAAAAAPAGFQALAGLAVDQQQMLVNYFLSREHGYTIWDSSRGAAPQELKVASSGLSPLQYEQFIAAFGRDRRNLLLGGFAADRLDGGMENDILVGGRGSDILRGNGGSDLFLITGPNDGNKTIEDFNVSENDVIDISRALVGSSSVLSNYVRITRSGADCTIGINSSGAGSAFMNLVLTLAGAQFTQDDLRPLVDSGSLVTGEKTFAPSFSILATVPAASQNGPVSGQFTLTRAGATNTPLFVNLQISGSALNGTDYQYVTPQIAFAAGVRSVVIPIVPYATTATLTNVAQVTVLGGSGYELVGSATAQVTIEPLRPQISVEAIDLVAVKNDQTQGSFLITRAGAVNNSVLVRLTLGGTAVNGTDYNSISMSVNFLPQQTTALIMVTPKSTAALSNGFKYVQMTIKADAAYKVANPSTDRVLLIEERLDFARWKQKFFPGSPQDWVVFASEDTGNTGVRNIFRYAFGLNAQLPQNSAGLPVGRILDDRLSISFKRPTAVTDLTYLVEVSDDLVNWRSAETDIEPFTAPGNTNDLETVSFRSKRSVNATPKQFMRVRVIVE